MGDETRRGGGVSGRSGVGWYKSSEFCKTSTIISIPLLKPLYIKVISVMNEMPLIV